MGNAPSNQLCSAIQESLDVETDRNFFKSAFSVLSKFESGILSMLRSTEDFIASATQRLHLEQR